MKRKVLLMGKSGSGKTSMRSIIFANYIARDTRRLGATIDVEHTHVNFLGDLNLNLWDCGGQEVFMENYFTSQKHTIFLNVAVLIYVFDIDSPQWEKDIEYYQSCLASIRESSKEAKIFCLIHKMDLISDDKRSVVFSERQDELQRLSLPLEVTCFGTSIWDETLYKAWSSIVVSLVPNVGAIESHLENFRSIIDADEIVLFERATFLVIAHSNADNEHYRDQHRFEKISNIVKQFKLSCAKSGSQFESLQLCNNNYSACMEAFTPNTYVLVLTHDRALPTAAILSNIESARHHFKALEAKRTAEA